MNPGDNPSSHLQFSLSEITRHISKHFKIDSETIANYIRSEYDDETSDSFSEADVVSFFYHENGQMNDLEEFVEAVICYSSTSIEIEKVKLDVVSFILNLLEIRKAEIEKMDIQFKTDIRWFKLSVEIIVRFKYNEIIP